MAIGLGIQFGFSARAYAPPANAGRAYATITVDDWTLLGGRDAHLYFTFNDWTEMAGSYFEANGGEITITTGVDFQAEVSNEQTAQNFADFCNENLGDPGEEICTVAGNVVTFNIPGDSNGFTITFTGSGVSPAEAVAAGGIAMTKIAINDEFGENCYVLMTSDPEIVDPGACQTGTSSVECATNIAAHASFATFTPLAYANHVTFYWPDPGAGGNDPANQVRILGREGGTPSGGISPAVAQFAGGV